MNLSKSSLLTFLLVHLYLSQVTSAFTVDDVRNNPKLLCRFIGHLLYSNETQTDFNGELVPSFSLLLSSDSSTSFSSNTSTIPRCFLPRIGSRRSDLKALSSIGPPLTPNDERHICFLYGCTKVPYTLRTTQLTPPRWPSVIYVVIVTEPYNTKCDGFRNLCLTSLTLLNKRNKVIQRRPRLSIDRVGGLLKLNKRDKVNIINTTAKFGPFEVTGGVVKRKKPLRNRAVPSISLGSFGKQPARRNPSVSNLVSRPLNPYLTTFTTSPATMTNSNTVRKDSMRVTPVIYSPMSLCEDVKSVLSINNTNGICSLNDTKIELTSNRSRPFTMCALSRTNEVMAMSPSMLPQACKFGCEVLTVMHAFSLQLIKLLLVDSCAQNFEIVAARVSLRSKNIQDFRIVPFSSSKGRGRSGVVPIEINMFKTSATVTSRRLPIPAIIKLDQPQTNRKKAVTNAIKKLRKQRGFSDFERKQAAKITYKWRKGKIFAVILHFHLRFFQELGEV